MNTPFKLTRTIVQLFLSVLFLFFLSNSFGDLVYAQQDPAGKNPPSQKNEIKTDENGHIILEKFRLTDEQKKHIIDICQKYSDEFEEIRFTVAKKKFELAQELRKEDPDRKAIDEILQALSSQESRKQKLVIDEFFDIKQVLNKNQQVLYTRRFTRQLMRMNP